MKFQYFDDSDMLYIKLIDGISTESEEVAPGIVLDFNDAGRVIGIELEDASKLIEMSQLEIQARPMMSFAVNRPQLVAA